MSNNCLTSKTHWIELDSFSNKELNTDEIKEIVSEIQKILLVYLKDKMGPNNYYSLDIKFFSHEGYSFLHHIIVDVQVFPNIKPDQKNLNVEAGIEKFQRGVTVVPPPPLPPVPMDFKILHPIVGDYVLRVQTLADLPLKASY